MSHTRSSGSLTNNSFSFNKTLLCATEPLDPAYLPLYVSPEDDCHYLRLRARETVLRGVNNLPKVTHLVSGKTNSLVLLDPECTCPTF